MKGDFTRFTFDPAKRYTTVLKQQGRVDLDADWNELSAIEDHLERTARMDLAGVACGSPSLAPGFAITLTAGGGDLDLDVSAGRFYAHGLICELFEPTTYLKQPYLPSRPPLAPVVNGQKDLVYLDVWQRHITAIEDPEIREVALGGPDTTTRLKTIFQIRVDHVAAGVDCSTAPLPAASGARLTTSIVPVPPEDDLCLIGPSGGFKGLENRLYRVEIHDPGNLGVATFKWSRDNGSVVFSIQEFVAGQPDRYRVSRLGRDQVLSLHEGDFVEVLDDVDELTNTPGTVVQIKAIDHANRELWLSAPVTGSMTDHPKVRRWDQKSAPVATGGGPIGLEDGIQISFSGSNFKTGDHWMFAARATDGTIEILTAEPPQGIVHHYCSLALVTWSVAAGGAITATIEICRPIFPAPSGGGDGDGDGKECCCCTVTVGDGKTSHGDFTEIQKAIDSLDALPDGEFAVVCILSGVHKLDTHVTIKRSRVLIRGCGPSSKILASPAFFVDSAAEVWFESLFFSSLGKFPAIVARNATELRIRDSEFLGFEGGVSSWSVALQSNVAVISGNRCQGGVLIMEGSSRIRIVDNRIEDGRSPGVALGCTFDVEFPLETGGKGLSEIEVRNNVIARNAGSGVCTLFDQFPEEKSFGDLRDVTISDNIIESNAFPDGVQGLANTPVAVGGIILERSRGVRIFQNRVAENGVRKRAACGIFLQNCSTIDIEDNAILDNGVAHAETEGALSGFQGGILAHLIRADLLKPGGLGELGPAGSPAMRVHDNAVTTPSGHALLIVALGAVSVEGNSLTCNGAHNQPGPLGRVRPVAVAIFDHGFVVGPSTDLLDRFSAAGGIVGELGMETGFDGRILFEGNQVAFHEVDEPAGGGVWVCGIIGLDACQIASNQFRALMRHPIMRVDVFAVGDMLSVVGNAFFESAREDAFSCVGFGRDGMMSLNQANHCLFVTGVTPAQTIFLNNQIPLNIKCASETKDVLNILGA